MSKIYYQLKYIKSLFEITVNGFLGKNSMTLEISFSTNSMPKLRKGCGFFVLLTKAI